MPAKSCEVGDSGWILETAPSLRAIHRRVRGGGLGWDLGEGEDIRRGVCFRGGMRSERCRNNGTRQSLVAVDERKRCGRQVPKIGWLRYRIKWIEVEKRWSQMGTTGRVRVLR